MYNRDDTLNPRIAVLILNWNGGLDTIECIESLTRNSYSNYDLVVVDNGSSDNSLEKIRAYCSGKITVGSPFFETRERTETIDLREMTGLESANLSLHSNKEHSESRGAGKIILIKVDKNYGFAEGNNIGIRFAVSVLNSEFVVVLNNDTAVDKEFLAELVSVVNSNADVGIVGPKSYHYDEPTIIGCTGGPVNSWTAAMNHSYAGEIDTGQFAEIEHRGFVSGTCMMLSRRLLEEADPLNRAYYFGGGEDVDLGLRATRKGLQVISTPRAMLWHKGESKQRLLMNESRMRLYSYYMVRNRIILIRTYWHGARFIVASCCLPFMFLRPAFNIIVSNKGLPKGIITTASRASYPFDRSGMVRFSRKPYDFLFNQNRFQTCVNRDMRDRSDESFFENEPAIGEDPHHRGLSEHHLLHRRRLSESDHWL